MGIPGVTPQQTNRSVLSRPHGWTWLLWCALVGVSVRRLVFELPHVSLLDLAVYLQAGTDVRSGVSPYVVRDGLPFTYPPFAAVLAAPLSGMVSGVDLEAAEVLVSLASGAALLLTVLILSDRLGLPRSSFWWTVPGVLVMSPVWRTFELGQVNLLLMALVVVDAFVVPKRWRGVLTGVAAGIKIVPGVFVVYYAATRQWRACWLAGLGFLGSVGLGWLVLPRDTPTFWFVLLRDPSRVGGLSYTDNVSLLASLIRTFGDGTSVVTWPLAAVVLAAGAVAAREVHRRGDDVGSLAIVAMAGLLASPVTWSHHWVWVVPIALWFVSHRLTPAAVLLLVVTYLTPLDLSQWLPSATARIPLGWLYPVVAVASTLLVLSRRRPQDSAGGANGSTEVGLETAATAPTTASQG